jgi:hypothetical protein
MASAPQADEITVATAPPVVVETVPQAGSTDVDPELREIRVSFSKEMLDRSWFLIKVSDATSPTAVGEPKYSGDKRTWVLPVKLEPGRTYAVRLNDDRFKNFKDTEGRSAMPYLLVFQTK